MKTLIISTGLVLVVTALVSFKVTTDPASVLKTPVLQENSKFEVPDDVKLILDKSCLPCHGSDGKSKAKIKWNYDKTFGMDQKKLVSKLSKIVSKVEKGKMPTSKFVKKYPDKKLNPDDKKLLIDWAEALAESLVK